MQEQDPVKRKPRTRRSVQEEVSQAIAFRPLLFCKQTVADDAWFSGGPCGGQADGEEEARSQGQSGQSAPRHQRRPQANHTLLGEGVWVQDATGKVRINRNVFVCHFNVSK